MYELRDGAKVALDKWMGERRGTIVLSTGYGKTRLGVFAHNSVASESTLVVTSKIPLKSQWSKEFDLVGYKGNVEYLCIQSAYKAVRKVNLLIVDECHKALSPVFRQLFSNIEYDHILCLTATPPVNEEYHEFLNTVAPICHLGTITEAVSQGAISPCKVINKKISLDKASRYKYNLFNKQFSEASISLMAMKRAAKLEGTVFDIAKTYKDQKSPIGAKSRQYWAGMSMRKSVLYNNPQKLVECKQIIERNPGNVWIIFTKTTELADKMTLLFKDARVYHYKLPAEQKAQTLKEYEEGKFHILVAVDGLTEGLNITRVTAGISASGNSSVLEQVQRQGRASRWQKGKLALFYNLYVPGTPEERWVTNKTTNLDVTYE